MGQGPKRARQPAAIFGSAQRNYSFKLSFSCDLTGAPSVTLAGLVSFRLVLRERLHRLLEPFEPLAERFVFRAELAVLLIHLRVQALDGR